MNGGNRVTTIETDRPHRTAAGEQPADAHAVLIALGEQRFEPVRPSAGYRLGLFVVAVLMLVLPLVYLALIALVCYGVWWFATRGIPTPRGSAEVIVEYFFYWLILICGVLLALFLIKPLLAPRAGRGIAVPL